jgi:hypothetical protein
MNVFVANCQEHNWDACVRGTLFGLKEGRALLPAEPGDVILMRVTGGSVETGVKALWYLDETVQVTQSTSVPWSDAAYGWLLRCSPILMLPRAFDETFRGPGKRSTKIPEFPAARIQPSMIHLKNFEAEAYLRNILQEFSDSLHLKFAYRGEERHVDEFLRAILSGFGLKATSQTNLVAEVANQQATADVVPEDSVEETALNYGVVGDRIDLPILNYSPLNEMGVILLFGYYLQDLGFSHIEEIRASFPDAIGMRPIGGGKYRRVRIEFEFRSRSFKQHKHDVKGCDVIVCWTHDWEDCPLEVIELRSALSVDV